MDRKNNKLLWVLAVGMIAGSQCTRNPPSPGYPQPLPGISSAAPARIYRLSGAGDLPRRGAFSSAQAGDFCLDNGRVTVVIKGLGHPLAGSVVDAVTAPRGTDALRFLTPLVGSGAGQPARWTRLETGVRSTTAYLRFIGEDPAHEEIQVIHQYALMPGSNTLRITTTILQEEPRSKTSGGDTTSPASAPTSTLPLAAAASQPAAGDPAYVVEDRIDWGNALPSAPGLGRFPQGRHQIAWIAAAQPSISYLYYAAAGALESNFSQLQSEVTLARFRLQSGQPRRVERFWAMGAGGGEAPLLTRALRTQQVLTGKLFISVTTDEGDLAPASTVEIWQEKGLYTSGATSGDGTLRLNLPLGQYILRAGKPGQQSPPTGVLITAGGGITSRLKLGPPSRLVFTIKEEGSQAPLPVKLTIIGQRGTPTPWLGPPWARAARNIFYSADGKGILPLPPGHYQITVSHGPEFTRQVVTLELRPEEGGSLVTTLQRVIHPGRYLNTSIGALTLKSPGCAVSLADRLLAQRAAGSAALIFSEHGAPDLVHQPDAADPLLLIPGRALELEQVGPISLFPSPARPLAESTDQARWVMAAQKQGSIVQLDSWEHFKQLLADQKDLDRQQLPARQWPRFIDTLRILGGGHEEEIESTLEAWFVLLRAGRRVVATGGAAHTTLLEGDLAGHPRTYIELPAETPPEKRAAALVEALHQGRAVVSRGPFIALSINDHLPGSTVRLGPAPRDRKRPRARVSRQSTAKKAEVTAKVEVTAPAWIGLESLTFYINGHPYDQPIVIPGRADSVRLEQTLTLPLAGDSFIVALVKGGPRLLPVALTNPVWIDVDGDGEITPPR